MRVCVDSFFAILCVIALFFVPDSYAAGNIAENDTAYLISSMDNYELSSENIDAEHFRLRMQYMLQHGNIEDLKRFIDDSERYNWKSSSQFFVGCEKILIKYILKDFNFLGNVDSISRYNYMHPEKQDSLFEIVINKIKPEIQSGVLEQILQDIRNESDRTFILIILNSFFQSREKTTDLIEHNKFRLKNQRQLEYLVSQYWSKENDDPSQKPIGNIGVSYTSFIGNVSNKVNSSFGLLGGISWNFSFLDYETLLNMNLGNCREFDSLYFFNMGLNLNLGHVFWKNENMMFRSFLTAGIEVNTSIKKDNDKNKKNDSPLQVFFVYGGGVAFDMFVFENDKTKSGIRFRAGAKNINADKILNASGFRLYFSIEFIITSNEKKIEFDYSEVGMDRNHTENFSKLH